MTSSLNTGLTVIVEPRAASQQCLSCHSELQSHFRGASALHRMADVACQDCHNPHVTTAQMLVNPESGEQAWRVSQDALREQGKGEQAAACAFHGRQYGCLQ